MSNAKRRPIRSGELMKKLSTVRKVHTITSRAARMYTPGTGITKRGSEKRKRVASYFKKKRQPGKKLLSGYYGMKN